MSFLLRKHYGYTEKEICDMIELYGLDWVYSAYKAAKEAEYTERIWSLQVIQAGQTPQSQKGAKGLQSYIKKLQKAAESQVPWLKARKEASEKIKREKLKPSPKIIFEGQGIPKDMQDFFRLAKLPVEEKKD